MYFYFGLNINWFFFLAVVYCTNYKQRSVMLKSSFVAKFKVSKAFWRSIDNSIRNFKLIIGKNIIFFLLVTFLHFLFGFFGLECNIRIYSYIRHIQRSSSINLKKIKIVYYSIMSFNSKMYLWHTETNKGWGGGLRYTLGICCRRPDLVKGFETVFFILVII